MIQTRGVFSGEAISCRSKPDLIMRLSVIICISCLLTVFAAGCAQTNPLSVTLMDPKTKAVRKCSARESAAKDIDALSNAVETCARQFEARGFVRIDD